MKMKNLGKILLGVMLLVFATVAYAAGPSPKGGDRPLTTQAWDQILPADDTGDPCNSARFQCVMGGDGVLDRETGLVWARNPGMNTTAGDNLRYDWYRAVFTCHRQGIGNRKGWRLPTVEELGSLMQATGLGLPVGHPFSVDHINGDDGGFQFIWSSTTYTRDPETFNDLLPGEAWAISKFSGPSSPRRKTEENFIWCVRGGQGHDGHGHAGNQ
jgi:hypothetical protein